MYILIDINIIYYRNIFAFDFAARSFMLASDISWLIFQSKIYAFCILIPIMSIASSGLIVQRIELTVSAI